MKRHFIIYIKELIIPFMPSGKVHLQVKESLVDFVLLFLYDSPVFNTNSIDPDQKLQNADMCNFSFMGC